MSVVKPFRAVRPKPDLVENVSCPPYDVVSYEEAKEFGKLPESFMHVIRAEIDLPPDVPHYGEPVYEKARENLEKMIKSGILVIEDKPAYYIYWQKMADHTQTGIVGCASVDEYQSGAIKKHELTRQDKEDDRAKHVHTVGANTGPVFLTFKADRDFNELLEELKNRLFPLYDFTDENGVQHKVFPVYEQKDIEKIKKAFEKIPALYIADGHHRAASASRVREIMKSQNSNHTGEEEYNYFLSVIFPHSQLQVLDYNRVVKDLNGLSEEEFIKKLEEAFEIERASVAPYKPAKKHEFGMYLSGKWYVLHAKENSFDAADPVARLDVSILQKNLLEPILGIENPRKDPRIDFIGGIRGLKTLEERVDRGWAVAFALYPTSLEDLMEVADMGMVMPPKSTWFEPKLRSGLFVHLLK
ncbi:hypothetical protein AT15_02845 [Kosmotoga arenicorallina S304]|uniref:SpoOJ/ParA/ParB/repB family protein n=1 Tax=Kosmotoga arenicorallina S304 TaxID=1453497 RepID=A0A176K422_9BACT|nr:DUF1015 family protein [Kosmotoga arenicorallina]OAA31781.1 hypothetical protein AT15_02845 [Kosmotoga arenicorallina S304]